MEIKILGPGCSKCQTLYKNTEKACQELGINAMITKVKDLNEIMEYPILITPALVVNEKVLFSGKVPSHEDIKSYLEKEQ